MDAQALMNDPDGMAFLAEVLGTTGASETAGSRFPIEAWMPTGRTAAGDEKSDGTADRLAQVG